MVKRADWVPVVSGALVIGVLAWAGRFPWGDAPGLLGTAAATARAPWAPFGQVIPHPPMGYLLSSWPWLLGFGEWAPLLAAVPALALVWWGMRQLTDAIPWPAWCVFLATPLTWGAVNNLEWDLLLAALVTGALGAMRRERMILAGLLISAAALTKLSAPIYLALPAAWVLFTRRNPRLLVAFVGLPWFLWHHQELLAYLSPSLAGDEQVQVAGVGDPLTSIAALRTAIGWPLLALVTLGVARGLRSAPMVALSALGGLALLSTLVFQEARYLLPVLPALLVLAERGLGRFRPLLALALVQFAFSAWNFSPAGRGYIQPYLDFSLMGWNWPTTPRQFHPLEASLEAWRVDEVLDGLEMDEVVAFRLPPDPSLPIAEFYQLRAEQRGLDPQFVAVEPVHGERPLPWGSTAWSQLYVMQRGPGGRTPEGLTELWSHALPENWTGVLYTRATGPEPQP